MRMLHHKCRISEGREWIPSVCCQPKKPSEQQTQSNLMATSQHSDFPCAMPKRPDSPRFSWGPQTDEMETIPINQETRAGGGLGHSNRRMDEGKITRRTVSWTAQLVCRPAESRHHDMPTHQEQRDTRVMIPRQRKGREHRKRLNRSGTWHLLP
jgi:hypothetical protein